MMPNLQIGPLALPLPELIIILGLWLGLNVSEKHASKFGLLPEQIFSLSLWSLVAGILASRLAYVIRYPEAFSSNWGDIFSRNIGLFDPTGGIAIAIIAIIIYSQRNKLSIMSILDALTPAILILQVALALSSLASGKAYGSPTQVPWGLELWGQVRHPTQVYTLFAGLLVLYMFWPARIKPHSVPAGIYFIQVIIFLSLSALFIEAFRGDSVLVFYGFRQTQLIAILFLASGLVTLRYLSYRNSTITNLNQEA